MRIANIGVLIDQELSEKRWKFGMNVFEAYIEEILSHAGLPYRRLDNPEQAIKENPDVLIVALAEENDKTAKGLFEYVEQGGHLISYAGINYLAKELGCFECAADPIGYASLPEDMMQSNVQLRYLRARPWRSSELFDILPDARGTLRNGGKSGAEAGAALLKLAYGQGTIERWSVDIPSTVVRMQQGSAPILEDGIPAEDGTGAVNDGILKADDSMELDWNMDRAYTERGSRYFEYPTADLWREALIGHLLRKATSLGLTLPFVGYWPDGIDQIALISHDSDLNIDDSAITTLQVLKECDIQSTWCMIEPGYSPEVTEQIKEAGHELALHYNALTAQDGLWDSDEFKRQFEWLKQSADLERIHSNKNHYTRFEGWGELFEWCESAGIEADQTRGPSKKGNVGFLFGTCHPYFPISYFDQKNRLYNVLELGFLTQDVEHPSFSDYSVIHPFLDQVSRVEGVAHLLFHQVHVHEQQDVRDALRRVVREAKEKGFVFWTCEQINDWERARRRIELAGVDELGDIVVHHKLDQAVVWVPVPDGHDSSKPLTKKFGVYCWKKVLNTVQQLN